MSRILIIDEDVDLRHLYQREFELEGYEAVAVGWGKESLQLLTSEKIDAVVLDFPSPDFLVRQPMQDILSRQRLVPIIINTGHGLLRHNFHCWGAAAFVVKSIDLTELKGALAQAIAAPKA
jgi:DNA-binding NtrC family response regulator